MLKYSKYEKKMMMIQTFCQTLHVNPSEYKIECRIHFHYLSGLLCNVYIPVVSIFPAALVTPRGFALLEEGTEDTSCSPQSACSYFPLSLNPLRCNECLRLEENHVTTCYAKTEAGFTSSQPPIG